MPTTMSMSARIASTTALASTAAVTLMFEFFEMRWFKCIIVGVAANSCEFNFN